MIVTLPPVGELERDIQAAVRAERHYRKRARRLRERALIQEVIGEKAEARLTRYYAAMCDAAAAAERKSAA